MGTKRTTEYNVFYDGYGMGTFANEICPDLIKAGFEFMELAHHVIAKNGVGIMAAIPYTEYFVFVGRSEGGSSDSWFVSDIDNRKSLQKFIEEAGINSQQGLEQRTE